MLPVPPLLCYATGFAATASMRGWRSLAIATASLALPSAALAWRVHAAAVAAPGGAALGAWLLFFLLAAFTTGLAGGAATRALLLGLRGRSAPWPARATALALGFGLVPGVFQLEVLRGERERQPPPADCTGRAHPVRVAGARYFLPVSPGTYLDAGGHGRYAMGGNRSLKQFCRKAATIAGPLPVLAVSMDAHRMRNTRHPLRIRYCSRPADILASSLCRQADARTARTGLVELDVYSASGWDHRRMIISAQGDHATFLARQRAGAGGREPSLDEGVLEGHAGGYWVARAGTWRNAAGEPFTVHCRDAPASAALRHCRTTYRLGADLQVSYGFHARRGRLEADARAVDRIVHAGLAWLAVPPR